MHQAEFLLKKGKKKKEKKEKKKNVISRRYLYCPGAEKIKGKGLGIAR